MTVGMGSPFGVMEIFWTWMEVMVVYNVAYVLYATELYMLKGFILCYVTLTSMNKLRKTEKAVTDLPGGARVRAQLSPPEPQVSDPFQSIHSLPSLSWVVLCLSLLGQLAILPWASFYLRR